VASSANLVRSAAIAISTSRVSGIQKDLENENEECTHYTDTDLIGYN